MRVWRSQRILTSASLPSLSSSSLPRHVPIHALPVRHHGGDMFVSGLVRTVNFAFFTANKKEYPGWYQSLMDVIKGSSIDRHYTKGMNYRRFGLRFEDLLLETPDVREALLRLPKDVLALRDDRIKRALVINTGGDELPKEQWTSQDNDLPYLAPYLSAVIQERRDREAFNPK